MTKEDIDRIASEYFNDKESEHEMDEVFDLAKKALEKQMQEPKPGHWIRELIRNEKGGCIGAKMICSKCGNDNKHDEYMNYCPNCGRRMVELQESQKWVNFAEDLIPILDEAERSDEE